MRSHPCALAIAGLDPSGGAGVLADLRAFGAASVWGCGAVSVVTVQSTAGMKSSHPIETRLLLDQVREIWAHQNVRCIKIGALGSTSNARAIDRWLGAIRPKVPVVLDPVMRPTRGAKRAALLGGTALSTLLGMLDRISLVTPNVPEAEALLGQSIRRIEDAESAARELVLLGARAALVKGGHLPVRRSSRTTTDVLAIGRRTVHFSAPTVKAQIHGTGCLLSSLVAGRLAHHRTALDDDAMIDAVRWAKTRLRRAMAAPIRIGDGLWVVAP